jgi:hypothetical protein
MFYKAAFGAEKEIDINLAFQPYGYLECSE